MSRPNFLEIKKNISMEEGARLLNLSLEAQDDGSFRGKCPACDSDDPRKLSIRQNDGKWTFKCFGDKDPTGTSVIDMAAHVLDVSVYEGAKWLSEKESNSPADPPQEEEQESVELPYLDKVPKLNPNHERVTEVGLNPAIAKVIGAGYSGAGVMQTAVAFPVFNWEEAVEAGLQPVGFVGYDKKSQLRLPKNFKGGSS
tara:strand:- start:6247 stop:6840 length:594 start_codon:yes stop_codon:yes gene_type:complete